MCDDDPMIRRVASLLLAAAGFDVVAEVDLAADAVRVAELSRADVVILDVALMGMSGLDAIPALRAVAPGCAVVVFSSFDNVSSEALAAGAHAVVDKSNPAGLEVVLAALAA